MFMNETMKPSCGEAYDATPVAVLAASETLTIALGMLTKSPVAAIVAGGLTGCVCSLALPAISGRILGRKRDAILSWWDENLEGGESRPRTEQTRRETRGTGPCDLVARCHEARPHQGTHA